MSIKIIFLDFDGVIINRESLSQQSGIYAKAHPSCVAALNRIIEETGAFIVISSTWRFGGLMQMKDFLSEWGVKGTVIDCTPDFTRKQESFERGDEIQAWLDSYNRYPIESFVILDDDSDMKHLKDRLVRTSYPDGLDMSHAEQVIRMLQAACVESEAVQ